jgi:CO dehydrogenase maturation factor
MIIGFLGKGGSGKSTLSTALVKYLHGTGNSVLAIDADHNMDLVWNLTNCDSLTYLGESVGDLNEHSGISRNESYKEIFSKNLYPKFSLNPIDSFTQKYSKQLEKNLYIMASGPHTETILSGNKCSHSLSTSLKIYLPFLELNDREVVIVDEKASSDAAGTGVPTGFTISYIVVEPTPHSIKAAHQIADTLDFYSSPYEFILNKVGSPELESFALSQLKKKPIAIFTLGLNAFDEESLSKMAKHAREVERSDPHARKNRSLNKFKVGREYAKEHNLS